MSTRAERLDAANGLLHVIAGCGRREHWNENWMWYGSYRDLEDGKPVEKFCSEECARSLHKSFKRINA